MIYYYYSSIFFLDNLLAIQLFSMNMEIDESASDLEIDESHSSVEINAEPTSAKRIRDQKDIITPKLVCVH